MRFLYGQMCWYPVVFTRARFFEERNELPEFGWYIVSISVIYAVLQIIRVRLIKVKPKVLCFWAIEYDWKTRIYFFPLATDFTTFIFVKYVVQMDILKEACVQIIYYTETYWKHIISTFRQIVDNLLYELYLAYQASLEMTGGLCPIYPIIVNGSQLAKMKKYIPHMSLPWNL